MLEINNIYNECCLETMKRVSDNSVDLIITSPPYNMRTRIRNGKYTTREKSEHFSKKYQYFDDALSIEDFYEFHCKALLEMLRISKIVCYNFQIVTGSKEAFFKIIGDFHKYIKDIIIWDKMRGQPAMHEKVLNSCYEMILVLENDNKCGRVIQNALFDRGTLNNIMRIPSQKRKQKIHMATFPDELVLNLITAFSKEDDLIYDPFLGIGTVAKIAKQNNRRYIGSEIVEEYFNLAKLNIEEI